MTESLKRSHFDYHFDSSDSSQSSPKRMCGAWSVETETPTAWNWPTFNPDFVHPSQELGNTKRRLESFEEENPAKRVLTESDFQEAQEKENFRNPYILNSNFKRRLSPPVEEETEELFGQLKRQRPDSFEPSTEFHSVWAPTSAYQQSPLIRSNMYALVPSNALPWKSYEFAEELGPFQKPFPPLYRQLGPLIPSQNLQLTVWEPPSLANGRIFTENTFPLSDEETMTSNGGGMDWTRTYAEAQ